MQTYRRRERSRLAVALCGLLAVAAVAAGGGCRGPGEPSLDADRNRAGAGQALLPDQNGRVNRSTTGATGIQGRWVAFSDLDECRQRGKHAATECSRFITPDPQAPSFGPTGDLGMCTVGVVAKVILSPDQKMDWANIYGVGIGLTLADEGTYDALAHGVAGFAFHIDSEPPPKGAIRVALSTAASSEDPPLWGGATSEKSPIHAGHNEFRWAEVAGPIYLVDPPRFDPTRLLSINFHVAPDPAGAGTFSFCISHLTALMK